MKRSYSYFIIKPDGIRYLDEILNDLEGKFQEIKYYAVDDFESLIKNYITNIMKRKVTISQAHMLHIYMELKKFSVIKHY